MKKGSLSFTNIPSGAGLFAFKINIYNPGFYVGTNSNNWCRCEIEQATQINI